MKLLITGGAGYIGTKLTKHLLSNNHKVLVVDNLWFGNQHTKHKNLKIIKEDIRNFDKLNIKNIPIAKPKSPTRLTKKAFIAALLAESFLYQKPIKK